MTSSPARSRSGAGVLQEVLAHASGRDQRNDPVLPVTGGPAGNAQLTAWMGLLLLALILGEFLTLVSVRRLITWHIVVGVLLIPPALVKTATTSWRMVRYYTGSEPYRAAGPPPLVLRLLGPLVVVTTLGVLASGTALIAFGPVRTFTPFVTVAGHPINWLTVHQGSFIIWSVATGLHVLARLVPSLRLVRAPRGAGHDGTGYRLLAVLLTAIAASVLAYLLVGLSGSWTSGGADRVRRDRGLGPETSQNLLSSSLPALRPSCVC